MNTSPLKPHGTSSSHRIYALVLAAGQGRRMGQLKQLLPYKEGTMLDAVLDAVMESTVEGMVLVANPLVAENLAGRLPDGDCRLVINDDATSEMLRSAQIGLLGVVEEFDATANDGVLVLLGDQPQIGGGTITSCAEAFRLPKHPPGILIATYQGRRGHPSIFRVDVMKEILDWPADRRLNELAQLHADMARELAIAAAAPPIDVDTAEDYLRLRDSE